MEDAISPFALLRHVRLPQMEDDTYLIVHGPLAPYVEPTIKHTASVRFIGRDCPLLETLLLAMYEYRGEEAYQLHAYEPLIQALKDVAGLCPNVRTLGFRAQNTPNICADIHGTVDYEWNRYHRKVDKLELNSILLAVAAT
jgi:hypothetical protein